MGCQCNKSSIFQDMSKEVVDYTKNTDDRKIRDPITSRSNGNLGKDNTKNISSPRSHKTSGYIEKAFEIINSIRTDPGGYADIIERAMTNIEREPVKKRNEKGEEITYLRLIYHQKVKVALTRGEQAFIEVCEMLRIMNSMEPLEFDQKLCLFLPSKKEDLKNITCDTDNGVYLKDLVKDPEVSVMLMIVDDNGKYSGKKREALLNPEYKKIGITAGIVEKSFVALISLSK